MIRVRCKWEDIKTGAILYEILAFDNLKEAKQFIERNRSADGNKTIPRIIKEAKIINQEKENDNAF